MSRAGRIPRQHVPCGMRCIYCRCMGCHPVTHCAIETAKANGLIPFDYVMTCLDELCQPVPDLEKLLPRTMAERKV
ncbi:hypothetical protein XBI1_1050006 [Xenorhabdus bovienii str. Intermedium]|uniref:Transposase IS66 C-terminal domain-containing protein n=1 Tax=Xenorhabdus bovienii str. Intermedium TaxID=1379677 RepID=A0A077QC70_XENBV|nr:hypothetical protein XBI1_1050006 [Xenorhabdus bovienii str. Intermedium]